MQSQIVFIHFPGSQSVGEETGGCYAGGSGTLGHLQIWPCDYVAVSGVAVHCLLEGLACSACLSQQPDLGLLHACISKSSTEQHLQMYITSLSC